MAKTKKGIRIAIVVEDQMLERFLRGCLLLLGYQSREIRVERAPSGKGSGKQWVNKRFVVEVKAMRTKPKQKLAVLVGTDVDELTISAREKQLEDALEKDGTGSRKSNERIAFWLPKWSIETWILKLAGEDVDETKTYKHQGSNPNFKSLTKAFVENYRTKSDLGLESIAHAQSETPRIES